MASIEEVEKWQRGIEDATGLRPGDIGDFSLVRFRKEVALRKTPTPTDSSKPVEFTFEEPYSDPFVLPDLRPIVAKVSRIVKKIAPIFNIVVK